MCVHLSFFRGHLLRGFALFLGLFLVPVWGGPSGVCMLARVRYFFGFIQQPKKSLVIFVVIVLVVEYLIMLDLSRLYVYGGPGGRPTGR